MYAFMFSVLYATSDKTAIFSYSDSVEKVQICSIV